MSAPDHISCLVAVPVQPCPQPMGMCSSVRLSDQAEPHTTSDVLFLVTDSPCLRLKCLLYAAWSEHILKCCKILPVFMLQSTKGSSAGDQGGDFALSKT